MFLSGGIDYWQIYQRSCERSISVIIALSIIRCLRVKGKKEIKNKKESN